MREWFTDFTPDNLSPDDPDTILEPSDDKTFNRFLLACAIVVGVWWWVK